MGSHKTPISILQELCTKRNLTPNYELLVNEGPVHEPLFVFQVTAGEWTSSGKGTSKKKAKHNAAYMLLIRLMNNMVTSTAENVMLRSLTGSAGLPVAEETFPYSSERVTTPAMEVAGLGTDEAESGNPVGQLQELCQHNLWPQPYYSFAMEAPGPYHNREFTCNVTLWKWAVQGCGKSKRLAKRRAALTMYKKIKDNQLTIPQEALDQMEEAQVPFMDRSAAEGGLSSAGVNSGVNSAPPAETEGLMEPVTREVAGFGGPFRNTKREKLSGRLNICLPPPDGDFVSMLETLGTEHHIPLIFTFIPTKSRSGKVQCLLQMQTVPQSVVHGTGFDLQSARQDAAKHALKILDLVSNVDEANFVEYIAREHLNQRESRLADHANDKQVIQTETKLVGKEQSEPNFEDLIKEELNQNEAVEDSR